MKVEVVTSIAEQFKLAISAIWRVGKEMREVGSKCRSSFMNRPNSVPTIQLKGRFVFQMHREFSAALGDALRPDGAELVIDLADVSYIDSAALGMLLIARTRALESGKRVAIEGATGDVLQVLHIANFEKLFEIRCGRRRGAF